MNQKHLLLSLFAVLLLVFGDCARQSVLAQTPDTQSGPASQNTKVLRPLPDHAGTGFNNAADRWRLTAVDPQSQIDTVSKVVRAQRNAYWKEPLESAYRLYTGGGSTSAVGMVSGGSYNTTAPEFRYVAGAAWVIATFENFHVYAIDPDYHLPYTEINFRVDHVIRAPEDLHLSAGILIDLGLPGGRVKTPHGNINSLHINPHQYFFQPGHKYLLQLLPVDKQSFFVELKRWDITSGTVQPDDPREVDRSNRGASAINGMSISDLLNYLPSALPTEPIK
jgi:hypothetical protein